MSQTPPAKAFLRAARASTARHLALALTLAGICATAPAQGKTPEVVAAAKTFLATLTPDQQQKVQYAFTDEAQRARWSNFPTGVVARGGINFKSMTPPQRDAAMKLLATVLSPMGLEKVNQIRQADDDFKANGSRRGGGGTRGGRPQGPPPGGQNGPLPQSGGPGGPGGGGPPSGGTRPPFSSDNLFGSDLYYISFLGTPSTTAPWMLQFGGHHLALNITIAGSRGVLTPTLTGAQPASFQHDGKTIRPIGRESDKALALLQSLNEQQRSQAILNYQVADLVLGPGQDGKKIVPEGLRASALHPAQQTMLLGLISEWAGILNEPSATTSMAQARADLNQTWFAWSGPSTAAPGTNITAYYRIQGPHLVIEYAPQNDEPANHVHTMYRDPTNDYGRALTQQP